MHAPLKRRLYALAAFLLYLAAFLVGFANILAQPLAVVLALVAISVGTGGLLEAATHTGGRRIVGSVVFILAIAIAIAALLAGELGRPIIAVLVLAVAAQALAARALHRDPYRPPESRTPPPSNPFFLMNPKSGGGKVGEYGLDEMARAKGGEVVLLERGLDVVAALEEAVAKGADLLGAAGGDGTQALVAEVAVAHDLPVLVIPAGTRNHFALDLGTRSGRPAQGARSARRRGCGDPGRSGPDRGSTLRQQRLAGDLRRDHQQPRIPRRQSHDRPRQAPSGRRTGVRERAPRADPRRR